LTDDQRRRLAAKGEALGQHLVAAVRERLGGLLKHDDRTAA